MLAVIKYVLTEADFAELISGGTVSARPLNWTLSQPTVMELRLADLGWHKMATLLGQAMEEARQKNRARAAYRDESYPPRLCDYCEQRYRGPAVFCSLECALASA